MHEHAVVSLPFSIGAKMFLVKALVLVVILFTAACSEGSDGQDVALFDVAGDREFVTAIDERASVPSGAQPAFVVRSFADPASFDELLAQAESVTQDDQHVITADLSGCILLTLWARPEPDRVRVGYEFDPNTDCAEEINYRALFILDEVGTNVAGNWDYTAAMPTVTVERQTSG